MRKKIRKKDTVREREKEENNLGGKIWGNS